MPDIQVFVEIYLQVGLKWHVLSNALLYDEFVRFNFKNYKNPCKKTKVNGPKYYISPLSVAEKNISKNFAAKETPQKSYLKTIKTVSASAA